MKPDILKLMDARHELYIKAKESSFQNTPDTIAWRKANNDYVKAKKVYYGN